MSIDTASFISISANITLAVFGVALALLVVWQDPRRLSNQYIGVSMTLFGLYGVFNTVWQVPQQYELEPEPLLYITTTLYIIAIILLFNFVIVFAGVPRRIRQIEHVISVPLGLVFIGLIWADRMYENFEPRPSGGYDYSLNPIGMVGVGLILLYLLVSVGLLLAQRQGKARELSAPMLILMAGIALFSAGPEVRRYSLNAMAMTVALVLLGRAVLKYQVFQPLADLNHELALKNVQLAEAAHMKSQFLANMSHELRTPLNSIIGYTDLVINRTYGDLNELQADRLRKVMRNGHLLLALINDVLDLSKIEAGRLDLIFARVPAHRLLDGLLEPYEMNAREKGLTLLRDYDELPMLWADEERVRQILGNLLSNAIKFTEHGRIVMRARFDSSSRRVVFSVEDTGIGIDPAHRERIFEAFQQTDGSLTRAYEGTGLGLTLARRLTEMHSGTIWLESQPGQGSTFFVALPLAEDYAVTPAIVQPGPNAKGPIILAIDDNREAVEVLQGHLEPSRFRVYGACSAAEGLRLAGDLRPVLITLDLRMPDMDGWQVIDMLKQNPQTASIPVLIITAADDGDVRKRVGSEYYLTKPVKTQDLLDRVRRLLATSLDRRETLS